MEYVHNIEFILAMILLFLFMLCILIKRKHIFVIYLLFFWFFFRPDGEKKAYVRLMPDYDALDVANKVHYFGIYVSIKIIASLKSSLLILIN